MGITIYADVTTLSLERFAACQSGCLSNLVKTNRVKNISIDQMSKKEKQALSNIWDEIKKQYSDLVGDAEFDFYQHLKERAQRVSITKSTTLHALSQLKELSETEASIENKIAIANDARVIPLFNFLKMITEIPGLEFDFSDPESIRNEINQIELKIEYFEERDTPYSLALHYFEDYYKAGGEQRTKIFFSNVVNVLGLMFTDKIDFNTTVFEYADYLRQANDQWSKIEIQFEKLKIQGNA